MMISHSDNMRKFGYITVGKVLEELNKEVMDLFHQDNPEIELEDIPKISRETFYRLEKRLKLPTGTRTTGNGWRVYTIQEKKEIKERIKKEYNLV